MGEVSSPLCVGEAGFPGQVAVKLEPVCEENENLAPLNITHDQVVCSLGEQMDDYEEESDWRVSITKVEPFNDQNYQNSQIYQNPQNLDYENLQNFQSLENISVSPSHDFLIQQSYANQLIHHTTLNPTPVRDPAVATDGNKPKRRFPCDQCEYAPTDKSSLRQHKLSVHEHKRFYCQDCQYDASAKSTLRKHRRVVHLGIRFPCDECDYTATSRSAVRKHQEVVHLQVRHPCVQDGCAYVATSQAGLIRHRKSVHDAQPVLACDLCPLVTKSATHLKRHRQSQHEGVRFACRVCSHKATRKDHLRRHMLRMHSIQDEM